MYGNRTAAGIKKLKESSYSKIGDPIFLAKRRRKHREDPRVRDRGSARDRANSKKWLFDIPTYKDLKPVPKYCEIFKNRIMEVGDGKSTDNSPTLDRIGNEEYYVSRRIDTEDGTEYVGNTQWVCRKANQMKSDATFKEIKMLYLWAVKEHKNGNLKQEGIVMKFKNLLRKEFLRGLMLGIVITLMFIIMTGFSSSALGSSRFNPIYVKIVD